MRNTRKLKLKKRILIIANDTGGANILAAWVKKYKSKYIFTFILEGPAKIVFRKNFSKFKNNKLTNLDELLKKIDFVLTGTSYFSDLERRAIKKAKDNKVRCASFLDHWINYRERFTSRGGQEAPILPDELWVGDNFAFKEALKNGFPKKILKQKSNPYFQEIRNYFAGCLLKKYNKERVILFMSAPISLRPRSSGAYENISEYDQLKMILGALAERKMRTLLVRLHPSEKESKFNAILWGFKGKLKIIKSKTIDIRKDIMKSDIVVGVDSMGLVLALLAKKKVISILPPGINKISIPFKGIEKVHSIKELTKKI